MSENMSDENKIKICIHIPKLSLLRVLCGISNALLMTVFASVMILIYSVCNYFYLVVSLVYNAYLDGMTMDTKNSSKNVNAFIDRVL